MIQRLRQERPDVSIEVEADRLEQVRAFLQIEGIDVILLDNMKPSEMREAVAHAQREQGEIRGERWSDSEKRPPDCCHGRRLHFRRRADSFRARDRLVSGIDECRSLSCATA